MSEVTVNAAHLDFAKNFDTVPMKGYSVNSYCMVLTVESYCGSKFS